MSSLTYPPLSPYSVIPINLDWSVHEFKMAIRAHLLAGLFLTSTVIQLSLAQHQHQQQQHPLSPNRHDASSSRDPFTSDFSAFVEQAMIDWHVAGLAISVVDGNETYAKV